ncbi:hypothetical protein [Tahibacter harae]|uniref:Uncharacterized protein n=1 Tax=Tahibacter harae TaxID=2963937 RepID=A0ABT1QP30_9GAMM|nr:hypothetical protein [Tahibacter harae]MCQ4163830.1 hypothetical protein [Tahibacter harae]
MPALARLTLALACALAPAVVFAAAAYVPLEQQLTPEQRRDTGLDGLTPAQLELLNRLLREKAEQAVDSAAKTTPQPATDAVVAGSETPRAVLMELEIRTIRSRLKGTVSGWAPGTEFQLENGQRWKVLKGEIQLRKALESPEILVVPGVAGRWFLQVDEDYPKARVYRID